MQAALVNALVASITKFWPTLEPLVMRAISKVARNLIEKARAGTFPDRWKFAEPVFDGIADELLKLFPAS